MTTAEQTEAFQILPQKNHIISINLSETWPTSARHSVYSVCSVDYNFSYYYRSFSCFLTTIFSMRFSVARSAFTTAAAAGAVCIILNQRLVSSLNPQDVVGPAARLFSVFSVFCGLKFRALSCLSWLLKTFGCGQQPLQVVSCLSWFNI